MSPPPTALDLDFGFGSLLDTGNGNVSAVAPGTASAGAGAGAGAFVSDFGTRGGGAAVATATDYLSLSQLFDSSSSSPAAGAPAWQTTKKLDPQQQQQQLQNDQTSLNALLSQHNASTSTSNSTGIAPTTASPPSAVATSVLQGNHPSASNTTAQSPFGFATREELESLAASVHAAAAPGSSPPQTTTSFAPAAPTALNAGSSSSTPIQNGAFHNHNNYMFVATIVDPSSEDVPPQQMLFLPGSNQVIPMPSSANSGLTTPMTMALANLPVVFPQAGSTTATSNAHHSFSLSDHTPTNWSNLQTPSSQQPQQQQQLPTGGVTSTPGLSSLEDAFLAAQASHQPIQMAAPVPTPLEFSSFGPLPSAELVVQQQPQQAQQQPLPAFGAVQTTAAALAAASSADKAAAATAMPVRPLSAYNFFFSDERERILQNKTDETDVFDHAKKQQLLLAHLAKDRSKRRPHRKTHGKINFTTLSKLIGQRWKQLPDERKNFYREVAAIDLERYQRELRERSPPTTNGGVVDPCA